MPHVLEHLLHFGPHLLRHQPRPRPVLLRQPRAQLLDRERPARHIASNGRRHVPDGRRIQDLVSRIPATGRHAPRTQPLRSLLAGRVQFLQDPRRFRRCLRCLSERHPGRLGRFCRCRGSLSLRHCLRLHSGFLWRGNGRFYGLRAPVPLARVFVHHHELVRRQFLHRLAREFARQVLARVRQPGRGLRLAGLRRLHAGAPLRAAQPGPRLGWGWGLHLWHRARLPGGHLFSEYRRGSRRPELRFALQPLRPHPGDLLSQRGPLPRAQGPLGQRGGPLEGPGLVDRAHRAQAAGK